MAPKRFGTASIIRTGHTNTHSVLTAIYPGEPGLTGCSIDAPSPFSAKTHPSWIGPNFPCHPQHNPTRSPAGLRFSASFTTRPRHCTHFNRCSTSVRPECLYVQRGRPRCYLDCESRYAGSRPGITRDWHVCRPGPAHNNKRHSYEFEFESITHARARNAIVSTAATQGRT